MFTIFRKIPLWLIIYFLLCGNADSQIINKFGLKGGALLNNLTSYDDDAVYTGFYRNYTEKSLLLSFDLGLFAEFFDSPKFCVSGELHYNVKGEENKNGVRITESEIQTPMTLRVLRSLIQKWNLVLPRVLVT